jgi:hypothetical protein
MRDLDALLNSLVNIDRNSLIAILTSEVEAVRRLANSARQRTASQCAKRHEAVERAARIERILSFFQHGDVAPEMSERDVTLCFYFRIPCNRRLDPYRPIRKQSHFTQSALAPGKCATLIALKLGELIVQFC